LSRRLAPRLSPELRADGLRPDREVPLREGRADVDGANGVVTIDPLPPDLAKGARIVVSDDIPPISVDYAASSRPLLGGFALSAIGRTPPINVWPLIARSRRLVPIRSTSQYATRFLRAVLP
jgi:hypothetical protein